MNQKNLINKYKPRVALVNEMDDSWIRSIAKPINLKKENEINLAKDLAKIMESYINSFEWIGASSNNIYWDGSIKPLRLIKVPRNKGKDLFTIINPEISGIDDEKYFSMEGCATLPNKVYLVERKARIKLSGYFLKDNKFLFEELIYDSLPLNYQGKKKLIEISEMSQGIVQHEVDHLNGIIISDSGVEYDFLTKTLKPSPPL